MKRRRFEPRRLKPVDEKPPYSKLYNELSEALKIDRNRLDDMLVDQAVMFKKASDEHIMAQSRLDRIKLRNDAIAAELAADIRRSYETEGQTRIADAAVQRDLATEPRYIQAIETKIKAEEDVGKWEGLKNAWARRSYTLTDLVRLVTSEYGVSSSAYGPETRDARERRAETIKRQAGIERAKRRKL